VTGTPGFWMAGVVEQPARTTATAVTHIMRFIGTSLLESRLF
jgi:hypothetical protein